MTKGGVDPPPLIGKNFEDEGRISPIYSPRKKTTTGEGKLFRLTSTSLREGSDNTRRRVTPHLKKDHREEESIYLQDPCIEKEIAASFL